MSDSSPNVVVFFTDQQRYDSTGVHGNPLGLTPNFDRIAACGTHLYNCVTPQPVCTPARACLQTGMYGSATGVHRNGIALPTTCRTLAQCYNGAGYETACIGKWHLAHGHCVNSHAVPEPQRGGYQYWLGADALELSSKPYHCIVYDNDNRETFLPGYRVDALTDAAVRYIGRPHDKPFFLFLSHIEPHFQNDVDACVAPRGHRQPYQSRWTPPDLLALPGVGPNFGGMIGGSAQQRLADYWGSVKRLDEAYGRLLDVLESTGQLDNTIVVFTSDHGTHFATRAGNDKCTCHDVSVRVPTVLSGPCFDGGGCIELATSLIDLPPTLLDACGVDVPPAMQGRSILPLLRGDDTDWPGESYIQISQNEVGRAIRTGRWKYGVVAPEADVRKDAGSDQYLETYLYDLLHDPYELCNLVSYASHQHVCETLRGKLIRRMMEAGETAPAIVPAPALPAGQRVVRPEEVDQ